MMSDMFWTERKRRYQFLKRKYKGAHTAYTRFYSPYIGPYHNR